MNIRYLKSVLLIISFLLLMFTNIVPARAVDHRQPVGEPCQLAGKRMVFTNWYFIRPGHFDWIDEQGNSVYAKSDAILDEHAARFVPQDSPQGIRLFAEPGQREIPILPTDRPWDRWGIRLVTLILENGKYRLWGSCNSDHKKTRNCYFESDDGIHWVKPVLGLVEFDGSRDNNLLEDQIRLSVFIDSNAPAAERYKTVYHSRISADEFEKYKNSRPWSVMATELDAPLVHVIKAGISADGLRWSELEDPICFEHGDTQNICHFDERLGKYVLYCRNHMLVPRAAGQPYPTQKYHQYIARRAVGRTESEDFRQFPLSEVILETDSDMHPSDQFYTNCRTTIPGAPDHPLMFPALYNVMDDQSEIVLYSSHDGKIWHRTPGPPVLGRQPFGKPDGGCFFAHPNLVERSDGDWILPYDGYNVPHKYPRGAYRFEPGLLVWRKGRLAGVEAQELGEFATVAFIAPGKFLRINAVTSRAGYIRVEVMDLDGRAIPGRSFDDALPVVGDHHRSIVTWKGGDSMGIDAGQPVWLRFRMKMARIYGLEFE